MPDENNLQSVEAVLAAPHNQPKQDVLAPTSGGATAVADGVFGTTPAMPTPVADKKNDVADAVFGGAVETTSTPTPLPLPAQNTQSQTRSVRQLLDAARGLVQRHLGDIEAVNPQMASAIERLYAPRGQAPSTPQSPATKTPDPQMPQMPAITMVAPSGGGAPLAGYDYKGSRVLLGDGIDVNDAEAVRARITENNELIDMIDSAYEED